MTSSDSENEHSIIMKSWNRNTITKKLSRVLRIFHCFSQPTVNSPKENIKEPKKDMIICRKTDKQDSWKQVKILYRAGKVGKSKSGKYKNHWNVLDDTLLDTRQCTGWLCCSGYHYCTISFKLARTQVLCRFKSCLWRVRDSRW